jgi:hypothetical protein
MDDGSTEPGLVVQVRDVQPGTADFEEVLALAALCWPRTVTWS